MRTQWTITRDCIADPSYPAPSNSNAVGMVGPRNATLTSAQIKKHPDRIAFKLYDDDGTLYYEGFLILNPDDDGERIFAPLDDFGMPNAGCTEMKILSSSGKWETI